MVTQMMISAPKILTNTVSCFFKLVGRQYSSRVSGSLTTVDQKDINHHSKQTNEWWNPIGPMKTLHTFNLIRVPFVRDGLIDNLSVKNSTPLKGQRILDVGCGGGLLSEPLAALGASVTGIDASEELTECAQSHSRSNARLGTNTPNYICTTAEKYAENNHNTYDGVVASEVIEHVNNKALFVKSCVQTLKPGGRIFFTSPTRTRVSQLGVIFLAEYVFKTIPRGTHQYEKFTTPGELSFLLKENNCQVEMIPGILYNFITKNWHWVNNQSFMFALRAKKNI